MYGCGTELPRDYDEPPECVCPGPKSEDAAAQLPPASPEDDAGLGDVVEALLTSIGITKDRYREVKKRFGLPPTCGCDVVQAALNRIAWFKKVRKWWRDQAKKPR
jgi:hypothetical protein